MSIETSAAVVRASSGRVVRSGPRGGLGVYADNRRRPIHRWYPFAEAFSSELINDSLAGCPSGTVVFDPFGGSGTTALAAAECGFDSFFTEANPYLAWLGITKVNTTANICDLAAALSELSSVAQLAGADSLERRPEPELDAINARRGFMPNSTLRTAAGAMRAADDLSPEVRELVRLAVAVCLIPASNMIRRTDLRKRTPGDPKPELLSRLLSAKLGEIAEDLQVAHETVRGRTTLLGNDAKALTTAPKPFDRIITSPPYLNGTNYCRNTKLELLLLGFINTESELETLRATSIAAGINNISKRRSAPVAIEPVEAVAEELDAVAYDVRIPALVRSYFSDMQEAMKRMRQSSADDCVLVLDIGDSRYSGIHVDTPLLLGAIAETVGWKLVDRRQLRARRSYDGTPLTQDLLTFQALPS